MVLTASRPIFLKVYPQINPTVAPTSASYIIYYIVNTKNSLKYYESTLKSDWKLIWDVKTIINN